MYSKKYIKIEFVTVAKVWNYLWLGMKDQSNLALAGFLRNIFRYKFIFKVKGKALFK